MEVRLIAEMVNCTRRGIGGTPVAPASRLDPRLRHVLLQIKEPSRSIVLLQLVRRVGPFLPLAVSVIFDSFVPATILFLPVYLAKSLPAPPFPFIVGSGDASLVHFHSIGILDATGAPVGLLQLLPTTKRPY